MLLRRSFKRTTKPVEKMTLAAWVGLCLVVGIGCHKPTHQDQQTRLENNWSRFRSDMKTQLARQQLENGRVDDALAGLVESVKLQPNDSSLQLVLAQAHLAKGDFQSAVKCVERAEGLGDRSAELHYCKGLIAERLNDYETACRAFGRALAGNPESLDYRLAVAEALIATTNLSRARETIEDTPISQRLNPKYLLLRAELCSMQGEWELAADYYSQLLDVFGEDKWTERRFGLALANCGKHEQAIAILKTHVTRAGGAPQPELSRALVKSYLAVDRPIEALRIAREHNRRFPQDPRGWWLTTSAALLIDDVSLAERAIGRGQQIAPNQPHWLFARACLSSKTGDAAGARALLKDVIRKYEDHPFVLAFNGPAESDRTTAVDPQSFSARRSVGGGSILTTWVSPAPDSTTTESGIQR
jgi:tetratricopeptide (TPR) repeat protein